MDNDGAKNTLRADVKRLKEAALRAAGKRERIPQELFWSLFQSEISRIKKKKALKRTLDELLSS